MRQEDRRSPRTTLREKGRERKKESARKKTKPMGTGTEKTTNNAGKKRATFARMVGKEKAEEQKEIQYKNCVVGFALGLTIETTPKGVLTKISLKVSHFCQHISTNMHPFMQSGET